MTLISIPRSGRRSRIFGRWFRGGAQRSRSDVRRRKRGPSGDGASKLRKLAQPKVFVQGVFYPAQSFPWPTFVKGECPPPINADCSELQVTAQWAVGCFKPLYHQLRQDEGPIPELIVETMMGSIGCAEVGTAAATELRRRLELAVVILLNAEGIPVRYPPEAVYPRPAKASWIRQPWLRALLTGWM